MWPDSPFAAARGSFEIPVFPPQTDPDASPSQSVVINCDWLPFIRGALQQLILQATWKVDTPADLLLAQQRAMTLIDLFQECSGSGVPFACPFIFFGSVAHGFDFRTGYSGEGCSADTIGGLGPLGFEDTTLTGCSVAGQLRGLDIQKTFSATTLNKVSVHFNIDKGLYNDPAHVAYAVTVLNGGSVVAQDLVRAVDLSNGTQTRELPFTAQTCTDIIVTIFSDFYAAPEATGAVTLEFVTVYGNGTSLCL